MEKKFCTQCGNEVTGDFCTNCGKKLEAFQKDKKSVYVENAKRAKDNLKVAVDNINVSGAIDFVKKERKHSKCTYTGLILLGVYVLVSVLGMILYYNGQMAYDVKKINSLASLVDMKVPMGTYFFLIAIQICLFVACVIKSIKSEKGSFVGFIFVMIYLAITVIAIIVGICIESSVSFSYSAFKSSIDGSLFSNMGIYVGTVCYFVGSMFFGGVFWIASLVLFCVGMSKEKKIRNSI